MRQRSSVLIIIALVLTFSVSCQQRGQSGNGSVAGTAGPTFSGESGGPSSDSSSKQPTGPIKSPGTADSGGGNVFLGKPIESYKIKVQNLEAYKKILAPIVEADVLKGTNIGNAIADMLDKKTWYLIPSELKQLTAEQIGAAVGGEQAALQDFKQVWLNSIIFDSMKIDEQATLLMHEIFMGLRLLKLDSSLNECLSFQSDFSKKDPQYCHSSFNSKVRGQPSDLKKDDYAQIREATAQVMEKRLQLQLVDWQNILESQGFWESVPKKESSLKELAEKIESSKLMKTWPQYGFDFGKFFSDNLEAFQSEPEKFENKELKSDQACDFDLQVEGDRFTAVLKENGQSIAYSSKWTSNFEMSLIKDLSGFRVYSANSPALKKTDEAVKGDTVVFVNMRFMGSLLVGADIQKTVCLDEKCSSMGQGINGYFLSCYTRPIIKLKDKSTP